MSYNILDMIQNGAKIVDVIHKFIHFNFVRCELFLFYSPFFYYLACLL